MVDSFWLMFVAVVHEPWWPTFDSCKHTYIFSFGRLLAIRQAVGEGLHFHGAHTSGSWMSGTLARTGWFQGMGEKGSSRFLQAQCTTVVRLWVPNMRWKRKRCWTVDAWCRLDSSFAPHYDSELDLGSPEALITRDEESTEEDRLFIPRFLFAHSPYEGVFHNRPSLQVTDQIGFACEEFRRLNA